MAGDLPVPAPREVDAVRAVFWRFTSLATAEQLVFHRICAAYLSVTLKVETTVGRAVARRLEALRCLGAVAQDAGLPAGVAPSAAQYRSAQKRLGLSLSATAIAEAFDTWATATSVFTGERTRESAAQRAIRRAVAGRRRQHEDYVVSVRIFLMRRVQVGEPTATEYDAFREEWNDNLADGRLPLLASVTIRDALSLTWAEVVKVARGEVTRKDALALREITQSTHADWGELVALRGVAAVLGRWRTALERTLTRPDFPAVVAIDGRARLWRRTDVEQFAAGTYGGETRYRELEPDLVFARELADLMGIKHSTLHAYLFRCPDSVPAPAGRAGGAYYWWRTDVMDWLAARGKGPPDATGRSDGEED